MARAQEVTDVGWLYWHLYKLSSGNCQSTRKFFLERAILETRFAIDWIYTYLDRNERDVEQLLVKARNNLAYYIYEMDISIEKVSQIDRSMALECVAYVVERASRFPEFYPELIDQFIDTIEKVAAHFGATTQD